MNPPTRKFRLLQLTVMIYLTLIFTVAWLPFIRSVMDGPSYSWNDGWFGIRFEGSGLSGDFLYAAVRASVAVLLIWLGWRHPVRWVRIVIAAYLALSLLNVAVVALSSPDTFRFRGDTLGLDFSLAVVAPLVSFIFMLAGLRWAMLNRPPEPKGLPKAGRILLATALGLLPVQYLLLSSSDGQQTGDIIGVLMTIVGWFLFSASFAVRGRDSLG